MITSAERGRPSKTLKRKPMNTTKSKPLANFLAIASIAMASVTAASADHHQPAEMLEGKVKQFYRQLSSGKFAEALDMMKDGACGYVAQGMRIDIANAQVK